MSSRTITHQIRSASLARRTQTRSSVNAGGSSRLFLPNEMQVHIGFSARPSEALKDSAESWYEDGHVHGSAVRPPVGEWDATSIVHVHISDEYRYGLKVATRCLDLIEQHLDTEAIVLTLANEFARTREGIRRVLAWMGVDDDLEQLHRMQMRQARRVLKASA